MRTTLKHLVLGCCCMSALASRIPADVVMLGANKDNTLLSEDDDRSNGSGIHLFAGRTAAGNIRRGLLAFDIAAGIPAGSTIDSVILQLNMSRTQSGGHSVALHPVTADWGEGASDANGQEGGGADAENGDATWAYTFYDAGDPPASPAWTATGGDFIGSSSASTTVSGEGFYTWGSTDDMVANVQAWLDAPVSNYGWIVIGNEGSSQTAKRFDSRQNGSASLRPQLTVQFTPPAGGTGACCFDDGTCMELSLADCNTQSGNYQGTDTVCIPNPCPQPGACCLPEGTCDDILEADCLDQGGVFQGQGTNCGATECIGACCQAAGACVETTASDCASQSGAYQGPATTCTPNDCAVLLTPFLDPLPIPATAQPVSGTVGGEATYHIAMQEFDQQLHAHLPPTRVWGYDGGYPGPLIEASSGLPVTVRWINDLRDEQGNLRTDHYLPVDLCPHGADLLPRTVVHLHGGHVPANVDGYPEDTFLPGQFVDYVYPNNQLPATLWFHDHALGITRLNVYMGLAGLYFLRDAFELDLGLPAGEFEIPLVIQDRSFHRDGTLKYPADWQDHFFGENILVNGKVWPFLEVKQGKYRFRLLNGSNSRVYTLALSTGDPFQQIGSDGGLLPAPVTLTEVTISPGERADVVMDFAAYAPGTEIILTNSAPAPYPGSPGEGVIPEVLKFNVVGLAGDTDPLPATLRPIEELLEQDAVQTRDFELRKFPEQCAGSEWLINELGWDDITEFPVLGTTEIWRFINRSGMVHPMHMHLVLFQVLDRQDFEVIDGDIVPSGNPVPPPDQEAGWKDTVQARPNQITRVIARFEDYAGLFSYHCHILEHEDHEMMRQFQAVECLSAADCADLDGDDIRDDPCRWWACEKNACVGMDVGYADFGGEFGSCPPEGATDSNDRFHALNCFSDKDTTGLPPYPCESDPPQAFNVDAAGLNAPCSPDGVCDGNDAFAALNAFDGSTSCSCPPGGGPLPSAPPARTVGTAGFVLRATPTRVAPGGLVQVEVFLDREVSDLRGYQLHLGVSGGRRGTLQLVDIAVSPRRDRALSAPGMWEAFNVGSAQMLAGRDGPGTVAAASAYLATFTYRAAPEAAGAFFVEVLHDEDDDSQRTVLFPTPPNARIAISSTKTTAIEVDWRRARRLNR